MTISFLHLIVLAGGHLYDPGLIFKHCSHFSLIRQSTTMKEVSVNCQTHQTHRGGAQSEEVLTYYYKP